MAKFKIENLDLYYGAYQALKDVTMSIDELKITALIGPLVAAEHTPQIMNRMNDLVEGCRISGRVLLDGEDIYGSIDTSLLRKRVVWYSKPNPFP